MAASLLIVGPNPAQAVADKHGSGSQYTDDNQKNGSSGQGGNVLRTPSNSVNDVLDMGSLGGAVKDPKPDLEPPPMDLGTGGGDLEDLATVNSFAPQDQVALRSVAVAEV